MNRSRLAFVFLLVLWAAVGNHQAAASSTLNADTMKVALHTATPEEDGFITKVLLLVDQGVLPVEMVQSTFLWAKKKPRYKFQYFKRGLILRASQAGITIAAS
jgi:hypothetical protein